MAGPFEMHRVFPSKYLAERGTDPDMLLNFVVLPTATHRRLHKVPDFSEISRVPDSVLESHFLDPGAVKAGDWARFREQRFKALSRLIDSVAYGRTVESGRD